MDHYESNKRFLIIVAILISQLIAVVIIGAVIIVQNETIQNNGIRVDNSQLRLDLKNQSLPDLDFM